MAHLDGAIERYHKLLEGNAFRDLAWAEELQANMRQHGLAESGRLLAPTLRPQFISRQDLQKLTRAAERLAVILDSIKAWALESPALLNRMYMLPAEKMLAALPSSSRPLATLRMSAQMDNGSFGLRGSDGCKPAAIAYSEILSKLFLDLPIVKEFERGHYKVSKLGGVRHLLNAINSEWKAFGGDKPPVIAVVECTQGCGNEASEGPLLAEMLKQCGAQAFAAAPEQLAFASGGKLRAGNREIDVVFRRFHTRELLVRSDLLHPLLQAYRERAVCVINDFRCEIGERRAFFDLVTDEKVLAKLSAEDRKLIRTYVPWTRVVRAGKTTYKEEPVDLLKFILQRREDLVLCPNEDSSEHRFFVGSEMNDAAWQRALQSALRTPYVVQEYSLRREIIPFFHYGDLQMKETCISVHPHIFGGKLQTVCSVLHSCSGGFAAPVGIAPVLLIE